MRALTGDLTFDELIALEERDERDPFEWALLLLEDEVGSSEILLAEAAEVLTEHAIYNSDDAVYPDPGFTGDYCIGVDHAIAVARRELRERSVWRKAQRTASRQRSPRRVHLGPAGRGALRTKRVRRTRSGRSTRGSPSSDSESPSDLAARRSRRPA